MTTFTVNTMADVVEPGDSVLSLREAANLANTTTTADIIGFDSAVKGNTLELPRPHEVSSAGFWPGGASCSSWSRT